LAVSELLAALGGNQGAASGGAPGPICLPHVAAALDRADDRVRNALRPYAARTVERALGCLANVSQRTDGEVPSGTLLSELATVEKVQALLMGSDATT
jgi:hypothetical protein